MSNRGRLLLIAIFPIFWLTWLFYLAFMGIKTNQVIYKKSLGFAWYTGYPFFALGLLLDVLFNFTFGTLYYREFPQEFLFTSRSARHMKSSDSVQRSRAETVCSTLLDPADQGHCL